MSHFSFFPHSKTITLLLENRSGLILLFFLILSGCPPSPNYNKEQGTFNMTAPSLLYFKNIRSIAYEQQTQEGTRIDLYKLKRFDTDNTRPILYPIIASNWMNDEAYLLIRTNNFKKGFAEPLNVVWQKEDSQGEYLLESSSWDNQYHFAHLIYQSINEGDQLSIRDRQGNLTPLFHKGMDRNNFMTTMRDYYRLTE